VRHVADAAVTALVPRVALASSIHTASLVVALIRASLVLAGESSPAGLARTSSFIANTSVAAVAGTPLFVTGGPSPTSETFGFPVLQKAVHHVPSITPIPRPSFLTGASAGNNITNTVSRALLRARIDVTAAASPARRAEAGAVVALAVVLAGHAIPVAQLIATVLLAPSRRTQAFSNLPVTSAAVVAVVGTLLEVAISATILRHTFTGSICLALAMVRTHWLSWTVLVATIQSPKTVRAGTGAVHATPVPRTIIRTRH
jgi:hypothetical protein